MQRAGIAKCVMGILAAVLLAGCSSTRFVPAGHYLLEDVKVRVNDSTGDIKGSDMLSYVRHRPNNKFFHLAKLKLGVYNMAGKDTTTRWSRWIKKLGEPPVIFDSVAAETDAAQLLKAMHNAGYMGATVTLDSFPRPDKKKIRLLYDINAGKPHVVKDMAYEFPDDSIRAQVMRDSARFVVKPGVRLDRTLLEEQRDYVVSRLRNRGYWAFNKDYITFTADTAEGSYDVGLTMTLHPADTLHNKLAVKTHSRYIVRNITYIVGYEPGDDRDPRRVEGVDSTTYRGINILYTGKRWLSPGVLYDNCFLTPGSFFRQRDIDRTYTALGRLSILKFVNVRLIPAGGVGDVGFVDAYILLTEGKSQSFTAEIEGTNSGGDLGASLALNYEHRNIGKGSETLDVGLRGQYETVSGDLSGFIHNRVTEYGLNLGLTYPRFIAPFLRDRFKRRVNATSELHASFTFQERPEYTRLISTAGWSWKWVERNQRHRYYVTPIDINYVYLPQSTNDFINHIAPNNPLLRYSYEDHFIMRAGFNFYYTNKRRIGSWTAAHQRNVWNVRANVETAGNLLFALSSIFEHRSNYTTDPYKIFGIHYSQYVRAEGDFSFLHAFNRRHSLALHAGLGVGVPYCNSTILPFEKRFYGGGANGVRGWEVRTLGPGRYAGSNSVSDFIYQCGDIKMEFSAEYRVKLFWVIEGAVFVDAGNIWTIRDYPTQPRGEFRFDSFYKELASSYGIGLRLDFNYFLLRVDLGMKAHNPAYGADPWPLLHPRWGRDRAFHFSIGYPF